MRGRGVLTRIEYFSSRRFEARDALAVDPRSALALHTLAFACGWTVFHQMAANPKHTLREATLAAAHAIDLDSADALGYALRGYCIMLGRQLDRYAEALADAQLAHKLNPNDMFVLEILAWAETTMGEHERAIEHGHQILRMNPRNARSYETYHLLSVANFIGKQYSEGIRWALRTINEKPEMLQPHMNLANCYVGTNDIAKARAAFAAAQRLGPESVKGSLEGTRGMADLRIAKDPTRFFASPPVLKTPAPPRRCGDHRAAPPRRYRLLVVDLTGAIMRR
jgi:adenylate cyclase